MPSIIPEFEYDVFISYRHNDNRSGWVTDFVNALSEELAATLKDPISIYFDKNPHDGLLETDHVDKSLEGKLKCLIFIPIISQTYCDPTSFAWKQEFLVFNRLSAQDALGPHIKLNNGNVASRILPVKVHDLDADDKALIEHEINGALRAVDFIFRSAGVNRPLLAHEDHPGDNTAKNFYRDQINKVANAVKAIVQAAKTTDNDTSRKSFSPTSVQAPSRIKAPLRSVLLGGIALLAVVGFWIYKSSAPAIVPARAIDKSLIVLPFADMSPGKDQEWFSDGLTEELLNSLSSLKDLRLISRTTSFSFKNKGMSAKRIADSLGVSHVLEGSVRKNDDHLRITVQLIKASDDSHLWSHTYDYTIDSVFKIQQHISTTVASSLEVLLDEKTREAMYYKGTKSVDAYQEYLKGMAFYRQAHATGNFNLLQDANRHFEHAIVLSPDFVQAYCDHGDIYRHSLLAGGNLECLRPLSEKEQFDRMARDLNKAISLTKNESERIGYSFTRDFFSTDWTRLRSYLLIKEPWWSGWEVFLTALDPDFGINRYVRHVDEDPYEDMVRYFAAISWANKNELDSALQLYKIDYTKSFLNARTKSFLYFRNHEYEKAREAFSAFKTETDGFSTFLEILNGRYAQGDTALIRRLASQPLVDSYGYSPILAYNALGEYGRSDSIAALLDKRLLGHVSLFYNVLQFGLHFHLSFTPNFVARLRELGIDPEEFERLRYKKINI